MQGSFAPVRVFLGPFDGSKILLLFDQKTFGFYKLYSVWAILKTLQYGGGGGGGGIMAPLVTLVFFWDSVRTEPSRYLLDDCTHKRKKQKESRQTYVPLKSSFHQLFKNQHFKDIK